MRQSWLTWLTYYPRYEIKITQQKEKSKSMKLRA